MAERIKDYRDLHLKRVHDERVKECPSIPEFADALTAYCLYPWCPAALEVPEVLGLSSIFTGLRRSPGMSLDFCLFLREFEILSTMNITS